MTAKPALDASDLAAIQARADAATLGPWQWAWDDDASPPLGQTYGVTDLGNHPVAVTSTSRDGHADADFIAHARTDIPALLAEVAELRAANERAEKDADQLAEWTGALLASNVDSLILTAVVHSAAPYNGPLDGKERLAAHDAAVAGRPKP